MDFNQIIQTLSIWLIPVIFAITLPFDIRDLRVDQHGEVKTIPAILGVDKTKQLSYASLCAALILATVNYYFHFYDLKILVGLGISYLVCVWFISFSTTERHDYFYSGLLDGTMIFQFLVVWSVSAFL